MATLDQITASAGFAHPNPAAPSPSTLMPPPPAPSPSQTPPVRKTLTIRNEKGLHARPAARFVACAGQFTAKVSVSKDGITVLATSIMGLLMLGAAQGQSLELEAEGPDGAQALEALGGMIEDGFGEC